MEIKPVYVCNRYLRLVLDVAREAGYATHESMEMGDWLRGLGQTVIAKSERTGKPPEELFPSYRNMMSEETRLVGEALNAEKPVD